MPLIPKKAAVIASAKKSFKIKKCPVCGKEFPLTNEYYPADKHKSNGFKSLCKWCHRKKNKKYYDTVIKKKNVIKKQTEVMEWEELV